MGEQLVEVANQRNVQCFASLGGTAIALGQLSAPEFDGIYDNLLERYSVAKQTWKKDQLWHDLTTMENHLWSISGNRNAA